MHPHRLALAIASIISATALTACATTGVASNDTTPVVGSWGGLHAALTLTATGGDITYDCAHGGLSAPLIPNAAGAFDVAGVHVPEHGGPVRIGEIPDSLPARYIGQISRDHMTLRVLMGADTLGPFDLQLGAAPQLFRCL
jgi:hypothetical protein